MQNRPTKTAERRIDGIMTRRTLLNLDDWNSNRISNAAAAALNCYLSALRDQRGSGESSAPAALRVSLRVYQL